MAELLRRDFLLNINGRQISATRDDGSPNEALRIQFTIVKSLKREPNTAKITIYNLSEDSRVAFQEKDLPTILEAGYIENRQTIFQGELTFGQNKLDDVNWTTTLQAGDGVKQFKSARINQAIRGPAKATDVLRTAAQALGVGLGNIQEKIAQGSVRGVLEEFANGIVLSGKAERQLTKVARSLGYAWSIQDGELLFLEDGASKVATLVRLNSRSGMIGSPEAGDGGIVRVRSLLQPELVPGRQINIESRQVNGFFRVEKSTFVGDTRGQDWYVDVEARPV